MKKLSYYIRKKLSRQAEKKLEQKAAEKAARDDAERQREIAAKFKHAGPGLVRVWFSYEEGRLLYKWLKRQVKAVPKRSVRSVVKDSIRQLKRGFQWERRRKLQQRSLPSKRAKKQKRSGKA